jgi:hypothetical protein
MPLRCSPTQLVFALRGAGRHKDYKDWVTNLNNDTLRVKDTIPKLGASVNLDPRDRAALDVWTWKLMTDNLPVWKRFLKQFLDTKQLMLRAGGLTGLDKIVEDNLKNIVGEMTRLSSAA